MSDVPTYALCDLGQHNTLFSLEIFKMAKTTSKKTESAEATAGAKETAETVTDTMTNSMKNAMDTYFDGLSTSSQQFAADLDKARARNARIMDSFLQTLENGQRDMLELSRAVAAAPTDYKANLQLAMETMNRRQECALEFSKTLYREQSEMSSEVSERAQEMFAPIKNANFDWMAPYKNMTNFWSANAK